MGEQIGINDIYRGARVEIEGTPYQIVDYEHVKPGKGQAFARIKMKNLLNGRIEQYTFKSADMLTLADCVEKEVEYSYSYGDVFVFMDYNTYEQVEVDKEVIGEKAGFLKEGDHVSAVIYQGRVIDINLPKYVVLKVTKTEVGLKGDRISKATKPAEVETGLTVAVPIFINEGDLIKIDTSTGKYVERVKE